MKEKKEEYTAIIFQNNTFPFSLINAT